MHQLKSVNTQSPKNAIKYTKRKVQFQDLPVQSWNSNVLFDCMFEFLFELLELEDYRKDIGYGNGFSFVAGRLPFRGRRYYAEGFFV